MKNVEIIKNNIFLRGLLDYIVAIIDKKLRTVLKKILRTNNKNCKL